MKYTILVVPLFLISYFPSESKGWGCPDNINPMSKFDKEKFLGTWYEYWYHKRLFKTPGKCTAMQFVQNKFDKDFIHITFVDRVKYNDVVHDGKLYKVNSKDTSGEFTLTYYYPKQNRITRKWYKKTATGTFKVLGTDEKVECWAVVYTCGKKAFLKNEHISVLVKGRDTSCVTKDQRTIIENVLSEAGSYELDSMETTDQVGCEKIDDPAAK